MNSVIKVLHVVPDLGYGGVEKVILNYYEQLDHDSYIFDFVTHGHTEDYHHTLNQQGSQIFYLKSIGQSGYSKYRQQVCDKINVSEYDIIHIHTGHLTGVYASIFKSLKAKKIVCHAHTTRCVNASHKVFMPLFRLLAVYFSDALVACGRDAGQFCFGKAECALLPNGLDYNTYNDITKEETDAVRQSLGIGKDDYVIGHVGHFSEQKNQLFLTEVIHRYLASDKNVKFVLVGDGPDRERIEDIVKQNGDREKVIFTGTRNDVELLMKAFDLFVLPSLFEGLPVVGIEAQAAECPCIFSDTIDKSVAVNSDACVFLPIDQGVDVWVKEIAKIRGRTFDDSVNIYDLLCKSGYEISVTSHKLREVYEALTKVKK